VIHPIAAIHLRGGAEKRQHDVDPSRWGTVGDTAGKILDPDRVADCFFGHLLIRDDGPPGRVGGIRSWKVQPVSGFGFDNLVSTVT
jgi:hypothetical protein